ncbi:hypothetical protein TNCV_387901 [Trichonephila clavipes]|nr:hypothetical protein TNCV_387901 [Trichonephila clavipes]
MTSPQGHFPDKTSIERCKKARGLQLKIWSVHNIIIVFFHDIYEVLTTCNYGGGSENNFHNSFLKERCYTRKKIIPIRDHICCIEYGRSISVEEMTHVQRIEEGRAVAGKRARDYSSKTQDGR